MNLEHGAAATRKGRGSLRRTLLLCFLSLSLAPLAGVSAISYWYTRRALYAGRVERLAAIANLKAAQIRAFFDDKLSDLGLQAESTANTRLLRALVEAFARSGKPLPEFVAGPAWATIADAWGGDLRTLRRTRGYDDILLIDTAGNLLFSVAGEADLGANLFLGDLSGTRFAAACREALKTGLPVFSDLERHAASNNTVAGFLVTTLLDETGRRIGLIAFQTQAHTIDAIMRESVGLGDTGQTYLVGMDGLLRSSTRGVGGTALTRRLKAEGTRLWIDKQGRQGPADVSAEHHQGTDVIVVRDTVDIAGITWAMFAEIDASEVLAPARDLAVLTLTLVAATGLLVLIVAIPIANRIVRPISELSRVTKLAAAGNLDEEAKTATRDEIGELAGSFNHMLRQRREAEGRLNEFTQGLEQKNLELDKALRAADEELAARKHAERALAAQKEQLVLLNTDLFTRNQELDEFSYVASHDLQEPLRKLSSFCSLLEKDIGADLPEAARQDMEFITDAAKRMQRLVHDLLALSRAGRSVMKREPVSLDDCADRALAALSAGVLETNAEITRDPLPEVVGDPTLLAQLYQNLIGNALKFVSAGVRPVIRLTAQVQDGSLVLGVRDNGIGIKPEYVAQIFAPFKRLHGRAEYEGSGIGLAVCRKTVQRLGGRLWVDSEPGKGSHFLFTIDEREMGREQG